MMPTRRYLAAFSMILLLVPLYAARGQQHDHLGQVNFDVSCTAEAQETFNQAVALLHHMMYEHAEERFQKAAAQDAACAMAYWGIAMTHFHPLWGEPPSAEALRRGKEAIDRARTVGRPSPRERAFIDAAAAFYEGDDTGYRNRLQAWETAQRRVYDTYPEDVDAGAFYALAHLSVAPPDDQTFAFQREAGSLLERLSERAPEHPAFFHYVIHAYDNPALAQEALEAAQGYDKLAPEVPHALHMPSHIFVRLGRWPEVVSWNERSAEAARPLVLEGSASVHYAHALDYLTYAYLQQGQDQKAHDVIGRFDVADEYYPALANAYALAAAPARYALERSQWDEAANLPLRKPANFAWDQFPTAESITYFARGLGAARRNDLRAARQAADRLDVLYQRLVDADENYWGALADAQRKSIRAWIAFAEDREDEALTLMREAADIEDGVGKHAVTPGAVLPARELLGDMLLLTDRPAAAMEAYEASLAISPNRLRSLYGMGLAAEMSGQSERAETYYTQLVDLTASADSERAEVLHARAFLENR